MLPSDSTFRKRNGTELTMCCKFMLLNNFPLRAAHAIDPSVTKQTAQGFLAPKTTAYQRQGMQKIYLTRSIVPHMKESEKLGEADERASQSNQIACAPRILVVFDAHGRCETPPRYAPDGPPTMPSYSERISVGRPLQRCHWTRMPTVRLHAQRLLCISPSCATWDFD